MDVDVVVQVNEEQAALLTATLTADFYADTESLKRAIRRHSSSHLVHRPSGIKIHLFVAHSPLDQRQLKRRRLVQLAGGRSIFMHSPEDILLQKLYWFRRGGENSERQWRDVVSIVRVQGDRLDEHYLSETASLVNIADLLERALAEARG